MSDEGQVIEVKPEDYSYVFSPYREPIAKVSPGDRVTTQSFLLPSVATRSVRTAEGRARPAQPSRHSCGGMKQEFGRE